MKGKAVRVTIKSTLYAGLILFGYLLSEQPYMLDAVCDVVTKEEKK